MIVEKIAAISSLGLTCIKNASNPYFNSKYADLSTVVEVLKEPLEKQGLVYKFVPVCVDGVWNLRMNIYDISNTAIEESEPYLFPLNPIDPQKMGASITYAKRYLLCTAFNVLAEEDDDGNEASGNKPTLPKKKPVALQTKQQAKTIDDIDDEVPSFFD